MAKDNKTVSAIDRLLMRAQADNEDIGNEDDAAKTTWPNLWIWLTRIDVGKNLMKEPARMAIKGVPGGFIGTLSDSTLKVAVDATSDSLAGIFDAFEAELSRINPVIRPYGKGDIKLKKRRKGD